MTSWFEAEATARVMVQQAVHESREYAELVAVLTGEELADVRADYYGPFIEGFLTGLDDRPAPRPPSDPALRDVAAAAYEQVATLAPGAKAGVVLFLSRMAEPASPARTPPDQGLRRLINALE
jgi:hypothetical protein